MISARVTTSLLAVAAVVIVAGCPARRDGISRDALERSFTTADGKDPLPTVQALLQLRVPTPASPPTALMGTASEQAFARGDEVNDADSGTDAALLRCLRADVLRDYAAIVSRCVDVVTTRPDDLRSAVVVALLRRHVPSINDEARRLIAKRTANVVASCKAARGAGSCAWLSIVVTDLQRDLALSLGDDIDDTGIFIDSADVDGPFIDADQSFVDRPREKRALLADPRRSRQRVVADDAGRLRPARKGPGGWYRMTTTGSVGADIDAHIFVDRDGPFELRVDGAVVLSRPRDVASAAVEWVPVHLARGGHAIEVLGWENGEGFAIAVLDDDGANIWQTPSARNATAKLASSTRTDRSAAFGALLLPPQIDGADAHQLVTTMLRHHAARAGLGASSDELQSLNAVLLAHFGWSPPALVLAAQGLEDDVLPARLTAALAAPLWARVEARWPTAPLPLLARARAAAVEQPDLALDLFRQLVRVAPLYPQGRRELLPRLLERDLVDEAVVVADDLVASGSGDDGDAIVSAFRAAGRATDAARVLDARAARSETSWRRDLQAGETEQVRAKLLALVADRSSDLAVSAESDAVFLAALDLLEPIDAVAALALIDARLTDSGPLQREMWRLRRARLLAIGTGPEAARRELAASPTTTIESLLLSSSLGAVTPWENELALGETIVAGRRAGPPPFPSHPMVLLLSHNAYDYADDGSALVMRHWIAEVRNKDAIDGIGEIERSDSELLVRLRVIKPDGSVFEPEHHAAVDDISLTGLSPGDLVEWLSVRVDRSAQVGGAYVMQSFATRLPVVDWQHTLSWPQALPNTRSVVLTSVLGAPAATTTTSDGRVTNTYRQRDVAPTLAEPMAVDDSEDFPHTVLTIDDDDDAVRLARWLALVPAARADQQLGDVARLVGGRGDDEERLRRIFRFVVERLTEADAPAEGIVTLATGQGQRLPVALALLRGAGLKVTPVALHPLLSGAVDQPTKTAFPTPALVVEIGDRQHVVAVVGDVALLDRLPSSFRGAHVLSLDTNERSTLPDTAIDPAVVEVEVELRLVDTDTVPALKGLAVLRLPAAVAEGVRRAVRGATPEQLAQFMEAGLAASLPGVAASNVTLPGLDSAGGPMAFVADIAVLTPDKTVRFEHLFGQGAAAAFRAGVPLAAFMQLADRHRTMRVWPHEERLSVVVHLPSSAGFVEVPPTTTIEAGPFQLRQRSAVDAGALVWERTISIEGARIAPQQWRAVRAALGPLIASTDARLAFVVGDTAAP